MIICMEKEGLIILVLLMNVCFVFADGDIGLEHPLNVETGKEFEVRVMLINFSEDIYDIKFEIKNGSNNIAHRFWDDKWKSTNYWVEDFLDLSERNNKTILFKISEKYDGINNFSVKIRDSDNEVFEFKGFFMNISFVEEIKDSSGSKTGVYYELDWNEDNIINSENFKIEINIFNLEKKKYDVKLWIKDKGKIISERYDEKNEEWKSGNYYIDEFFEGPGNKSEKIKIRIKDEYKNFSGEAEIFFKTREGDGINKTIEILKRVKVLNKTEELVVEYKKVEENSVISGEVIRLGSRINNAEDVKAEDLKAKNILIYESKTEKIKKYSVYAFTFFVVVFCVLIVWRKL